MGVVGMAEGPKAVVADDEVSTSPSAELATTP
jgi:hypothetical protein